MCCIEPSNLPGELRCLKIGVDSINWYKEEISKYDRIVKGVGRQPLQPVQSVTTDSGTNARDERFLDEFEKTFLAKATTPSV